MAQLWVNVAARNKLDPPEHHAIAASEVPVLSDLAEGATVRLFAGDLDGRSGPAPLGTPVLIAHVSLLAGSGVTIPVPAGWNAGLCVVAGEVDLADHPTMGEGATPVFEGDGDGISVSSASGGQVLLMAGLPIGEPIAMGGGFVMNTEEEIHQAFDDYHSGRFGELAPSRCI